MATAPSTDKGSNEDVIAAVMQPDSSIDVGFVRSFSDEQKLQLLEMCCAVVYTPTNEHFGIVPIETMAACRPVIACNSGGPLESVDDQRTGFLCSPDPSSFAKAMKAVVADESACLAIGRCGHERVQRLFSRQSFGLRLDSICKHLCRTGSLKGWSDPC